MEDADLDIGLARVEAARGEVEEREVVLAREVLDVTATGANRRSSGCSERG